MTSPSSARPAPGSPREIPNILSIAGTDPTGGAGIHADLKSFAAHGGYGMAVVTALVAQNTQGVREIHLPPVSFLQAQLEAVSDDVSLDAVKVGMLGTVDVIETVSTWWDALPGRPWLVVDPVMVATSGDRLLQPDAEQALIGFLHRADLITPNIPELALLAGGPPSEDGESLIRQARTVADAHDVVVLAKGGHFDDDEVEDILVHPAEDDGTRRPEGRHVSERIRTTNTHGTGCSVSSALAALRARGLDWETAVPVVKEWMTAALRDTERLDVGRGHGPIQHFAQLWERRF
ncbi:bifunctional hydroxymethylpyrimidine kinase/phosphomethylpyrimidine kinase [Nesterenkonia xinjiangensis]|uniref:Hydroxymethylpyrimidine kinase/phosphomethylpyrimidine kinase n=1 Tax=Nesterenkonia xinjiangensis TaxID=225327 RepID=A0A7Z0KB22_9MICC|nr:bifunctional hydroxymethylpyrimidine kinase/phosphomethylpyrimidine kinase [Nesterenkonia xinjiangensis]NYJ79503.1 hydroxymethylpyrimidine kinase/phosphomethylpyrimidine kinase [Nesterenkonia xinjiangensis]